METEIATCLKDNGQSLIINSIKKCKWIDFRYNSESTAKNLVCERSSSLPSVRQSGVFKRGPSDLKVSMELTFFNGETFHFKFGSYFLEMQCNSEFFTFASIGSNGK